MSADRATISVSPLSVWLIGNGDEPTVYTVQDRRNDRGGEFSFMGMSIVERAALRALLTEAIAMIDRSES